MKTLLKIIGAAAVLALPWMRVDAQQLVGNLTVQQYVRNADGTAAAPSWRFTTYPTTGLFLSGANAIGVSTAGVERWIFNASGSFVPLIDNTYDIGNGTVNPRDIYAARNLRVGGVFTFAAGSASSITAAASTDLTLAGGSSGASLVLRNGATAGTVVITPTGTNEVSYASIVGSKTSTTALNNVLLRVASSGSGADSTINFTDATTYNGYMGMAAGNLNFGANTTTPQMRLVTTGNLLIGGTTDISGSGGLKVFGTTAATTTTSGALQVAGGAGIVENLYVGGNVVATGAVLGKVLVAPKTQAASPYSVLTTEPRTLFTNEGATSIVTFSLPTAAANLSYTFYVQDADGIIIDAASGDTIRFGATVTAADGDITSTTIGSSITLTAINSTEWVATALVGVFAD